MDNDVSVARLSDDDDWNDRTPPGPGSRMRMLAVMGAVVVGCGVAAIVVNLTPDEPTDQADDGAERIVVIDPSRTDLYPTSSVGPTTSDDTLTETSNPTRQISSSPQDGNLGGGGDPNEPESDIPDESDEDGDTGDEDDEDEDTGEPTTTVPSSPPSPPSPSSPSGPTGTPPSSTPPTTTPPEEDEEEEECTPAWWIGCWW